MTKHKSKDTSWHAAFPHKLKTLREDAQLTQLQLGRMCGIAGSKLSNYERGREMPSLDTFRELCIELNVKAGYMLGLEHED